MHFLITAGGTREYIDPVRFISNASSGTMGYCLADAAANAGHKVTLISASSLQPPLGVEFIGVDSAAQMFKAVKDNFEKTTCLIMAAAVSDYTPAKVSKTKIKKQQASLTIQLKPTKDILKWASNQLKKNKDKTILVGFALEDTDIKANAEKKLTEKNLDMIIANTPDAIGSDISEIHIKIKDDNWESFKSADKKTHAARIIKMIEKL